EAAEGRSEEIAADNLDEVEDRGNAEQEEHQCALHPGERKIDPGERLTHAQHVRYLESSGTGQSPIRSRGPYRPYRCPRRRGLNRRSSLRLPTFSPRQR